MAARQTSKGKQKAARKGSTPSKRKKSKKKGGGITRGWKRRFRPALNRLARLPRPTARQLVDAAGILLTIAGILTVLAMIAPDQTALVQPWLDLLAHLFGMLAIIVPLGLITLGCWLVARHFLSPPTPPWYRLFGLALFMLALFGTLGTIQLWQTSNVVEAYGGQVGFSLATGMVLAVGELGTPLAILVMALLGLLFLLELSLEEIVRKVEQYRPSRPPAPVKQAPLPEEEEAPARQLPLPSLSRMIERTRGLWRFLSRWRDEAPSASFARPAVLAAKGIIGGGNVAPSAPPAPSPWQLPPWEEMLEEHDEQDSDPEDIRGKVNTIEGTLREFGVPVRVVEVNRGPTVTQFGVQPGYVRKRVRGKERDVKVKVSKITSLQNDLALALAAPRIRIEAPVPGKHYIGIEVPNDAATQVTLGSTMASDAFRSLRSPLRLALGRDVTGNAVVADLTSMPHLLIAGSTGSGKSVCINSIISALLCHHTPDELKLLMVDPKTVELTGYNGIPHLIVPVVTDLERVVGLLRWTINEMERRYKLFSEHQARNLAAYNEWAAGEGEKPLPYLVLIIDELADLMMAAADQVEAMLCRLAQMARATGIHLILATQRPSVDVVTGLIKANFPARIAFAVTSITDSRVILDQGGAETLLGQGDMLYMASDSSALKRAQGCFVSDQELEQITRFWLRQSGDLPPAAAPSKQADQAHPEPVEPVQAVMWDDLLAENEDEEEDELLPQAREVVQKAGNASVSMLQRRLRVGFARAARLIDLLESEGTIGSSEGPGKTREVYFPEKENR